jgi:GNAT superfamily N-acetyltransferase
MYIREAIAADADAACDVLRRSITELCVADHRDNPTALSAWLRNKTPPGFLSWLRPGNSVLVAVIGNDLAAVGSVTDSGMITLNYVSPVHRFRGISKGMLAALEARAVARGNDRCRLSSTITAARFYRANGYADDGAPDVLFGIPGYPMIKSLRS